MLREFGESAPLSMTPPDVWDSERAMSSRVYAADVACAFAASSGAVGGVGLAMFSTRDAGPPQRV